MSVNVGLNSDVYQSYVPAQNRASGKAENARSKDTAKAAAEAGAVYEKSSDTEAKKSTYSINKMSAEDRKALVQQLKQDQADRQSQLVSIVQQMLSKQAGATNLAQMFTPDKLKNIDPVAITQAQEDISEDGYWGVKQTSQRLFDFASALAGDDEEMMKKMQAAMEKGFKQATKAWGQDLPGICSDTIAAANKLFDDYYKSKEVISE